MINIYVKGQEEKMKLIQAMLMTLKEMPIEEANEFTLPEILTDDHIPEGQIYVIDDNDPNNRQAYKINNFAGDPK